MTPMMKSLFPQVDSVCLYALSLTQLSTYGIPIIHKPVIPHDLVCGNIFSSLHITPADLMRAEFQYTLHHAPSSRQVQPVQAFTQIDRAPQSSAIESSESEDYPKLL